MSAPVSKANRSGRFFLALCVSLAFGLTETRAADSPEARLVAGINDLGLKILASKAHSHSNTLISPASLGFSLALLDQGADATASKELEALLHLSGMSKEELRKNAHVLRDELFAPPKDRPGFYPSRRTNAAKNLQLSVAQSIWVDHRLNPEAPFILAAQSDFASELVGVDFDNPIACRLINAWVSEKTHGRIPLAPCPTAHPPYYPIALINAVYFKDDWAFSFEPKKTKPRRFSGAPKSSRPNVMHETRYHGYTEINGDQSVRLDYASGSFAMELVLPKKSKGLQRFLDETDNSALRNLSDGTRYMSKLKLRLPKFEFWDEQELNSDLKAMGLKRAFEPGGLSEIGAEGNLEQALQKTFVRVDEIGTEAAAVTFFGVQGTLGIGRPPPPPPPIKVYFDRPFLFTIRHRETGLLLFTGVIWNLPNPK